MPYLKEVLDEAFEGFEVGADMTAEQIANTAYQDALAAAKEG